MKIMLTISPLEKALRVLIETVTLRVVVTGVIQVILKLSKIAWNFKDML